MPPILEITHPVGVPFKVQLNPTDQHEAPMALSQQVNWDTPDDPAQTVIAYNPGPVDPTEAVGVNEGIVELRGFDGVAQIRARITITPEVQIESGAYASEEPA